MAVRIKQCDYGHSTTGSVRRLNTGGGSAVLVCRRHWDHEMRWRKERNASLTGKSRFPIRKFPGR